MERKDRSHIRASFAHCCRARGGRSTGLVLRATIYIVTRSIELSEEAVLVLASLVGGAKHGYAMITDVEAHTGRRLGPGTLYGIVARLETAGYIRPLGVEERGRRPYRITPAGKRAFEERLGRLQRYGKALRALATS
jgi:DNA-binding MarR family transcriptional regulator